MKQYHELKTWPEFYKKVISGEKPFEMRKDDRGFKVDDVLLLREWSPETEEYTGSLAWYDISYILKDFEYEGICQGFCIMGLKESITSLDTLYLVFPEVL